MSDAFLEVADRIGARLCRDAIWDGGRCNWVADYGEKSAAVRALDPWLYSGTSGIALFLQRLYRATGEIVFRDTARAALDQALSQVQRYRSEGLYTGIAGVAYVAAEFDELVPPHSAQSGSRENDLIAGRAGALVAALHRHFLDDAVGHGEMLLKAARQTGAGWSWPTIVDYALPGRPDLTGFAHGAAGIAWALLELWKSTGEQKYRRAAEEGFQYEQSWFSAERGNWPDLRKYSSSYPVAAYSDMWCHGAAGIAFSRLRAAQLTGDVRYQEQAELALQVVERGLKNWGNGCICHGLFGSIDLLLFTNARERITLAQDAAREAVDRYPGHRLPWPCGNAGDRETPDLMLGVSGIGHTLLRLSNPSASPSPLMTIPCPSR